MAPCALPRLCMSPPPCRKELDDMGQEYNVRIRKVGLELRITESYLWNHILIINYTAFTLQK